MNRNILIIAIFCLLFIACKKSGLNEVAETSDTTSFSVPEVRSTLYSRNLHVYVNDKVDIHPELFGVNNDWTQVTNANFHNFANAMSDISAKIIRFPGGWESEFYKWATNQTPGWSSAPVVAGASIGTLKYQMGLHGIAYGIVVPTNAAMEKTINTTAFNNAVDSLANVALAAIDSAGAANVKIVEIGNEWWLQYAAGSSRANKLDKYVKIAIGIAERIYSQYPSHTFKVLVNGDWTVPFEFTTMKNGFAGHSNAYNTLDGLALHPYAGYEPKAPYASYNIADLQTKLQSCVNNFNPNKKYLYCSEWMPSRAVNNNKAYMETANIIPDFIQIFARSRVNAAAYWPPMNPTVSGNGLFTYAYTSIYPVAQIFKELADNFYGKCVSTVSDSLHIAGALHPDNKLYLYVTGGKWDATTANITVHGYAVSSVVSVTRFRPYNSSNTQSANGYITDDMTASYAALSSNVVSFDMNTLSPYEIYRIVLSVSP
ncbi:hypothetical protein HDC92_001803 [Pedobacter sp. AK017]|uniref:hypothetical protein n=1 Tax=Pedobacter sp. AK017 TaxID=2723073 RepID=UPI001620DA9B|nr:hypothetical protein [Pedobacter sp. AK017]MBB5438128.1 hypothetical protein [Pedobacter sp. AK017]